MTRYWHIDLTCLPYALRRFLSVKVYWDDHKVQHFTLVPREHTIDVSPTGASVESHDVIAAHLAKVLNAWGLMPGLEEAKVFFTTDRGTNVKKALTEASWADNIPCLSHVLHRAVLEAISAFSGGAGGGAGSSRGQPDMGDVWGKVTDLGRSLHASPNRTSRFEAF